MCCIFSIQQFWGFKKTSKKTLSKLLQEVKTLNKPQWKLYENKTRAQRRTRWKKAQV